MTRYEYLDAADLRREAKKIGRKVLIAEAQNDIENPYEGKVGTILGIDKIENILGSTRIHYLIRICEDLVSIADDGHGNLLYAPGDLEEGGGLERRPCEDCDFCPCEFDDGLDTCDACGKGKEWDEKLEKLKERCTRI